MSSVRGRARDRHAHQPLGRGATARCVGGRRRDGHDRTARGRRPGRPPAVRGPGELPARRPLDLPGEDADEEADIEGLAARDFLWAIGSHSLRRRRIKGAQRGQGLRGSQGDRPTAAAAPAACRGRRRAAHPVRELAVDGEPTGPPGSAPTAPTCDLLADDEHLAPFLPIPSKDNGLDIEGIAVTGERVYLGLRGPVLRAGPSSSSPPRRGPGRAGPLELRPFEDGRQYRKLLRLDGLGVRDLCPQGRTCSCSPGRPWTSTAVTCSAGTTRARRHPQVVRGDLLTARSTCPTTWAPTTRRGSACSGRPPARRLRQPLPARLSADGWSPTSSPAAPLPLARGRSYPAGRNVGWWGRRRDGGPQGRDRRQE